MADVLIQAERSVEPRNFHVSERPIDFETWLTATQGLDTDLVKGVMADRMAAQYPHEWIFMWLASILRSYTRNRKLGVILGSRTAVKIDQYGGRLPDILFVRAENAAIIRNDAIYGAPDVVIEIVSPNDSRADLISLEADYRAVGVPEIVFIDPQKKVLTVLVRSDGGGYTATALTTGRFELRAIPGFWLELDWIFAETQPDEFEVAGRLIHDAERAGS